MPPDVLLSVGLQQYEVHEFPLIYGHKCAPLTGENVVGNRYGSMHFQHALKFRVRDASGFKRIELNMPDCCRGEPLKAVLIFLYEGKIQCKDDETLVSIYFIAQKLQIYELESQIAAYFRAEITNPPNTENVNLLLDVLLVAQELDLDRRKFPFCEIAKAVGRAAALADEDKLKLINLDTCRKLFSDRIIGFSDETKVFDICSSVARQAILDEIPNQEITEMWAEC